MSGTGLSAWHLYPQPMPSPKEVIVIHSDSSEPAPERPHSGIHSLSSRPPALPALAEGSVCNETAAATTVALTASAAANSPASATINPHTPPHPLASSGDEPAQPRYMTRSVVQNATRRKQEQLMLEMQQQARGHLSGTALSAFTFSQSSHANSTAAASAQSNPYSLLAYSQQQQQQQSSGTWTTSALYQAARAVAAAVNTDGSGQIPQPPATEKQPKAAPPAKRRKNAAATKAAAAATTTQQRGGRGRANQRSKQQQVSAN
ncbi:hypothetical protein EV183_000615 [Coemansia sp. RSA 2336]|nr:hypothetical protein EV183_000615 [Coemansia sp. RSA 2336]